jgi:Flp pilus assembly protein TadG
MPERLPDLFTRASRRIRASALPERLRGSEDGQSLVEFALIFPLFVILVMGIIEFSLAFNAVLGINRASEHAVLVASEAGNDVAADCYILQEIEDTVQTPNDKNMIVQVSIQRTNPSGGTVYASSVYDRGGSLTCTLSSGSTMTVPWTATSSGYPPSQRCNVVIGCTTLSPARSTVDTIGVTVRYTYNWKTPLGSILRAVGGSGSWGTGLTFNKRNVMRVEPVL